MNHSSGLRIFILLLFIGATNLCKAQFTNILYTDYFPETIYADTVDQKLYIGGSYEFIDSMNVDGLCRFDMVTHQIETFAMSRRHGFSVATIKRIGSNILVGGNLGYYDSLNHPTSTAMLVYDGNDFVFPHVSANPPGYQQTVLTFEQDGSSILVGGYIDWYNYYSNVYDIIRLPLSADYYNFSILPAISHDNSDYVKTLKMYNGCLYAGGNFQSLNGVRDFVRLDNNGQWQSVAVPFNGTFSGINCMMEWNGLLLVGGNFRSVAGDPGDLILAYDGTNWIQMGNLGTGTVNSMVEYKGELYISGAFTLSTGVNCLAKWNGSDWESVDGAYLDNGAGNMTTDGNDLYICGTFRHLNGSPCAQLLRYTKLVGLSENSHKVEKLKSYPNPAKASETIIILCPEEWSKVNSRIELYNLQGSKIEIKNPQINQGKILLTLPGNIAGGIYQLNIKSGTVIGSALISVQ